jgi:hypothetical protein
MKHIEEFNKHINEELDRSTYRSAIDLGKTRKDDKGDSIAKTASELLAKSIGKELAGKQFIVKPRNKEDFQKRIDSLRGGRTSERAPLTGQYRIEFNDYCEVREQKEDRLILVVSAKIETANERGGWGSDVSLDGYSGADKSHFLLDIKDKSVVSLYTYNWETKLQFDRKDAREIAEIAKIAYQGMTGEEGEDIKHNHILQFDPYVNKEK